jgi:YebC/PmpR family DNA-binding regulatory protein
MSRHSKWSKVKQFKGAIDAKRSASFTKLAREIVVATREKGADPEMNPRLRVAIGRAREASMPKENIERAIARGAGTGEEGQIDSLMYEAYAPGGTALVIECLTDNRNRAASEVKHVLSKHGGTFASSGAVTYLFDHVGMVRVPNGLPSDRRDEMELLLIDAGASNIEETDEGVEIVSLPTELAKVGDAASKLGLVADTVELQWVPKILVETNEEVGTHVAELIELLEENDDVSRVFSNLA